jgi:hypothetical protein
MDGAVFDSSMQQDPFTIIRCLADDEHILWWRCFRGGDRGRRTVYEADAAFERCWNGFTKIARSTWWMRMWT